MLNASDKCTDIQICEYIQFLDIRMDFSVASAINMQKIDLDTPSKAKVLGAGSHHAIPLHPWRAQKTMDTLFNIKTIQLQYR